jgi:hypothetical protein
VGFDLIFFSPDEETSHTQEEGCRVNDPYQYGLFLDERK